MPIQSHQNLTTQLNTMPRNKIHSFSLFSKHKKIGKYENRKGLQLEITGSDGARTVIGAKKSLVDYEKTKIVKVHLKGRPAIIKATDPNNPDITVFSIKTPHGTYKSNFSHKAFNESFIEARAIVLKEHNS